MGKLDDRVAVITGGASGIGKAIAICFASEGANIAANDINPEAANETVNLIKKMNRKAIAIRANVAEPEEVDNMIDQVIDGLGNIHILVNNAGIGQRSPTIDTAVENWDKVISIVLRGTFLCSKKAGRWMIDNEGGCIVNIASTGGIAVVPEIAAYGPVKAGIINMTRVLAVEWAKSGIRVNALAPSYTRTAMVTERIEDGFIDVEQVYKEIPLGRMAEPEDIAAAALFLASDDASFITGVTLPVDGGYLCLGYHTV